MQRQTCSLQSKALFPQPTQWHLLEPEDWSHLNLPHHVTDQVFRVLLAKTPVAHLFEVTVSEQCPKDAYGHFGKAVARLDTCYAIINVIHGKSPNAHLMFLRTGSTAHFHSLDLDFAHLSLFDREVMTALRKLTPAALEALFRLLDGHDAGTAFYRTLKRHLRKIPARKEHTWQALVDLVLKLIFLIFVQRKSWLDFNPRYLETKMDQCRLHGLSILQCFLKPLFARLEGNRVAEPIALGALPRLGGGLFAYRSEALPAIDNDWCLELYEALISQYSYSLFEARCGRRVVGISPEVLGHVFENLLFPSERKEQGTFYTPFEVAEKQVAAAFEAWLKSNAAEARPKTTKQLLRTIRILDPSCGSGTYLVAAQSVLLQHRLALEPERERYNGKLFALKRAIILENLFGIDINPMAVRLAEIRLWLNMIQDLEISEPAKAPALPNLQHHLRPGDFLAAHLPVGSHQARQWTKYENLESLRKKFPFSSSQKRSQLLKHIYRLERELAAFLLEREQGQHKAVVKTRLAQGTLPGLAGVAQSGMARGRKNANLLHVIFSRVFLEGGFDLILGNPPWLSAARIPTAERASLRVNVRPPAGLVLKGQTDLSLYFLAASLSLLKPGGHLGFLLPGKILQARYASTVRAWLMTRCRIDYLYDYGIDQDFLFKADTFPLALGISLTAPDGQHQVEVEQYGKQISRVTTIPQGRLADRSGHWVLQRWASRQEHADWPLLKELPHEIQRGIVTNSKRHFVFERPPIFLAKKHLRPLLRGRDMIETKPGAWIYWPFDDGPHWYDHLEEDERAWLEGTGKVRHRGHRGELPYKPKTFGPWLIIWKYLARTWKPALLAAGDWIPDQTTYFINFQRFEIAYRYLAWFHNEHVDLRLRAIAERGKDRCYFFYAHTCGQLPVPPNLERCLLAIPEEGSRPRPLTPLVLKANGMAKDVS